MHRIRDVRRLEGVSVRAVAAKFKIKVSEAMRRERPTYDMPLSELHEWGRVLEVPITELLTEASSELSEPIGRRARLVRVMKTACAILETSGEQRVHRLARRLIDQLLEVMPELAEVKAWHAVGERRRGDEPGVAAERTLPESLFMAAAD